jgi:NTP pyrophosphatase (non-canonical NTP hydrolase)
MEEHLKTHKEEVGDELADTLYWLILMSHDFDIDLLSALDRKLTKIEAKYPVEKSKGRHSKYTEYEK